MNVATNVPENSTKLKPQYMKSIIYDKQGWFFQLFKIDSSLKIKLRASTCQQAEEEKSCDHVIWWRKNFFQKTNINLQFKNSQQIENTDEYYLLDKEPNINLQ